ncbi:MAG: aminoglycoside phosphotransferase family protein [Desulfobacterales bacterium]|nr:aminoglycoside phosphotransferase family protein [Desulfobacterales bacterium]
MLLFCIVGWIRWKQIEKLALYEIVIQYSVADMKERNSINLQYIAAHLAEQAGFEGPFRLVPIPGGKNNKVFKLQSNKNTFLLKSYFYHERDKRDRLGNEFSFISFTWGQGIRVVPEPFAIDPPHLIGLYEFAVGSKLCPAEVKKDHIQQAINFCLDINRVKEKTEAKALPAASEACFSINEHISCVDSRLNRLQKIEGDNTVIREATKFIHSELTPVWAEVKDEAGKQAQESGFNLNRCIPPEERCLSPSDFGFHNAILEKKGFLRFIDFEYAGWDDPAKLVCDFFCQPAVPAPLQYFTMFQNAVAGQFPNTEILCKRIEILLPVYNLKWCCIIMNEFLSEGIARRDFAKKSDQDRQKRIQLKKARSYLSCFTGRK